MKKSTTSTKRLDNSALTDNEKFKHLNLVYEEPNTKKTNPDSKEQKREMSDIERRRLCWEYKNFRERKRPLK